MITKLNTSPIYREQPVKKTIVKANQLNNVVPYENCKQQKTPNFALYFAKSKSVGFSAVEKSPELTLLRKKDISNLPKADVVVFIAHPDDETFFFGFLPKLIKEGKTVQLVYTTSGDALRGTGFDVVHSPEQASEREQELLKAGKVLGFNRNPLMLEFHDKETREGDNPKEIKQLASRILEKVQPKEVYSFGPEGITQHGDHIIAGNASLKAVREYNNGQKEKIAFYQVGFSPEQTEGLKQQYPEGGWSRTVPIEGDITRTIELNPDDINIIMESMACHGSQLDSDTLNNFRRFFQQNPKINLVECGTIN